VTGVRLGGEPPQGAAWPGSLDVDGLLRAGWRPAPFRQFILKIHSRCNLACDYCYVYRSPDQTWRDQPGQMSERTVAEAANRISQHVRRHRLAATQVVLHGGEPLLVGPDQLDQICRALRRPMPPGVELDLYVQTNGTLLDEPILAVLRRHHVRVGVSLDGPAAVQDARRPRTGGRTSHDLVTSGLDRLRAPASRHLFAGLLSVVDLRADPVALYDHLLEHEPPAIDLLLPHANWSSPPASRSPSTPAPHGEWLVAVFDRWYAAGRPETRVRLFEAVIRGLLGRQSPVESLGLSPVRAVVVETDGSIEQIDTLKTAYPGATHTGLRVRHDPFDAALLVPGIVARQIGREALAETCRRCELHPVCGGGYYPHRYHRTTGFRNPSVYCQDLALLIRHVRSRLAADLQRARSVPLSA
jgi:uncharacterized protein